MNAELLQEVKRTVAALYPELAEEHLFREIAEPHSSAKSTTIDMKARAAHCTDCALHVGRKNSVYGAGALDAKIVFIGDAPSDADDDAGKVFSDDAGTLLDRMIAAMNLSPSSVYKTNLVKCRPPQNRTPQENEVHKCLPYLDAELTEVGAPVIVALGEAAGQFFSRTDVDIEHLRGKWYEYQGAKVMITHHPRTLVNIPAKKKDAWTDLQLVMKELSR